MKINFMGLLDHQCQKELTACQLENQLLLSIIKTQSLTIQIQAQAILNLTKHPDTVTFDVIFNNTKIKKAMADISLAIGSPKTGVFTLIDNKTQLPIVSPTFSNQAVGANSNPAAATFALDASNNAAIGTGLAAGSGTIVFTTDAAYTDPGDGSSQTATGLSITKNFTVLPSPDGVSFDVVFP